MKRLLTLLIFLSAPFLVCAQTPATIQIATYIEPPFADIVDGQYVGRNIRIAKLLAKSYQKNVNFIYCPMARCLLMLKTGQADMIISILKTPERSEYLDFIKPPIVEQIHPINFYTQKNSAITINTYDDLKHLIVGSIRGSRYFERFDRDNKLEKVQFNDRKQMIQMLLKGRIDAFIAREESILPLVDEQTYDEQFTKQAYQFSKPVYGYIAISKKSPFAKESQLISAKITKLLKNGDIRAAINTPVPFLSKSSGES
ncbi:substrate-binding periplasmic protein [Litorilituus sediminis]|uniref:Transporter substrate-binding domain-containing protein n=1 Tax=Litorilituus sediminis TaxID=718192 RepID=A0A4P6P0M8_9GAMM|nr:transporter substrate-binding domain-containing protein [Litorilituus sediminis]QBG34676.1 transporter substrate-binding domain-containing protein [Litorilituus sediminis]